MKYPPYSCLMSVYAGESAVNCRTAIDSVLAQTVTPAEFVIVKDGPLTPELEELLDNYLLLSPDLFKFVSVETRHGLWSALKTGVEKCSNEIIMRMDSDDYAAPERAHVQLGILVEKKFGCCGTNVLEFVENTDNTLSKVVLPEGHEEIVQYSKKRNPIRHPSLMYLRSAVLAAGNYREMPFFEDYDLIVRLLQKGYRVHNVQSDLVRMRVSKDYFARRGSLNYMLHMMRFRVSLLNSGYVTLGEFISSAVPHAVVCLLPNRLRTHIYLMYLRNRV